MIRLELYQEGIDEPLVPNLSPDFSMEIIRENPLFALRGDYTYEIEISLRDSHNKKIYNHIERLNSNEYPKNRKARIIYAGRVLCEGPEIILEKDGESVKIQILSSNSELNYIVADKNLRIREMDFGEIGEIDAETASSVAGSIYPEANFAFPMIYTDTERDRYRNIPSNSNLNTIVYDSSTQLMPCPYLLYYVERFVTLLGYRLIRNDLRDNNKWLRLIIIHGYENTNKYSKLLPDWSAQEFIEEIEKFFNCSILIDSINRTAMIVDTNLHAQYTENIEIKRDEICDTFDVVKDKDDVVFLHDYRSIGYKLGESEFFKYAKINEETKKKCIYEKASPEQVLASNETDWKIFESTIDDFEFIKLVQTYNGYNGMRRVEQFKDYEAIEGNKTELRISPAETMLGGPSLGWGQGGQQLWSIAYARIKKNAEDADFRQYILDNAEKDETVEIMTVGFYGMIYGRLYYNNNTPYFNKGVVKRPSCFNYHYYPFVNNDDPDTGDTIPAYVKIYNIDDSDFAGASRMTLELCGSGGRAETDYNSSIYETNNEYRIKIKSKWVDPTSLYNINGRVFVCRQIKYKFSNGTMEPMMEGIFYPRIS